MVYERKELRRIWQRGKAKVKTGAAKTEGKAAQGKATRNGVMFNDAAKKGTRGEALRGRSGRGAKRSAQAAWWKASALFSGASPQQGKKCAGGASRSE
jgi:hypothetical protein